MRGDCFVFMFRKVMHDESGSFPLVGDLAVAPRLDRACSDIPFPHLCSPAMTQTILDAPANLAITSSFFDLQPLPLPLPLPLPMPMPLASTRPQP